MQGVNEMRKITAVQKFGGEHSKILEQLFSALHASRHEVTIFVADCDGHSIFICARDTALRSALVCQIAYCYRNSDRVFLSSWHRTSYDLTQLSQIFC